MSVFWDFVTIWKEHTDSVNPPADFPTFLVTGSVNGSGLCSYLSAGVVRKLVYSISGAGHLNGQLVSAVGDGDLTTPSQQIVSGGSLTFSYPVATIHIGLPYTGTLKMLPLSGDGQTVNATKTRKVYDIVLRVWKSIAGYFGKSPSSTFPISYSESNNHNPDDSVLFTGDIHYTPFESSFGEYWELTLEINEPLPFMLLAAVIRSEIEEDK